MKNTMLYLRYALLFIGIILSVLLLWKTPGWFAPTGQNLDVSELATLQLESRKVLAQILLGVGVLFGLYIIYRRIIAIEKDIQITKEIQITDRFSKAVEQLGTYKLEVQLGGIFTLEKIAKESEKDHWIIMEILTAYVRENVPIIDSNEEGSDYHRNVANGTDAHKQKRLPTNIQTILSVIGRRKWLDSEIEQGQFLNLRKTNLRYADLRGATLIGANFRGANLAKANLMGANLAGAFLAEANLSNTNIVNANLKGADLRRVNFKGTKLTGVNFEGANFAGANLKGTDLSESLLTDVNFNNFRLNIKYDEQTIFPDWLNQGKRDELGMVFELNR